MTSLRVMILVAGVLSFQAANSGPAETPPDRAVREAVSAWRKAGYSQKGELKAAVHEAAREARRPDVVEMVLAGGPVMRKMLTVPKGGRQVRLKVLRTFQDFPAKLEDEMFGSFGHLDGWLARRLTTNRIEVWTPKHGWLFDGKGQLISEARPERRSGKGREWYGAFLPDGRWITTDLDDWDGTLSFFSAKGVLQRTMTGEDLAPGNVNDRDLIGWARSDKDGKGWVVSVGSEEGRATVWVGPDGPARILKGVERWLLCFTRALGPRGSAWEMSVPSDDGIYELLRGGAGHGPSVGYPSYSYGRRSDFIRAAERMATETEEGTEGTFEFCDVPNGRYVFGFWPGRHSYFIGSEGHNAWLGEYPDDTPENEIEPSGSRTRKQMEIDKTWFFDAKERMLAWLRGRRIADAADGHAMLFRMTADSRIVTLRPDLKVQAVRRMMWRDGSTADAVVLWDDLQMGLFVREERLVLARWE